MCFLNSVHQNVLVDITGEPAHFIYFTEKFLGNITTVYTALDPKMKTASAIERPIPTKIQSCLSGCADSRTNYE